MIYPSEIMLFYFKNIKTHWKTSYRICKENWLR